MSSLRTTLVLVFAVSFFVVTRATENIKVNEIRELLKDSQDYQNWCSECRVNNTYPDTDLYIKLCHKFDAKMMEILEALQVNLTDTQFFGIFMNDEFCVNASVPLLPITKLWNTTARYPGAIYQTVLNDIPGFNDTSIYIWKRVQNREGSCSLWWSIPLTVVVVILVVILGITYIWYRLKKTAETKQITDGQNQPETGKVFDSIENL